MFRMSYGATGSGSDIYLVTDLGFEKHFDVNGILSTEGSAAG